MLSCKTIFILAKHPKIHRGIRGYRHAHRIVSRIITKHLSLRSILFLITVCVTISPCVFATMKVSVRQTDPLYLPFQLSDFEALERGRLQATLGSYDITSLVSYDNTGFYLNLVGVVDTGNYPINITIIMQDGQSISLIRDTITLFDSERYGGIELRSNTAYRVDESDAADFSQSVKRLTESAMRLQAKHLGPKTSIHSYAELQHRSDGNTFSGDKLEIANFQVGLERSTTIGNLGFALGNQHIDEQGLVFNGFNRRGVSAGLSGEKKHYRIKTFFINSDPEISSKENVILASDEREQSAGAIFDVDVFSTKPGRLRISGGYIDGQSELGGTGIGLSSTYYPSDSTPIAYGGRAWNISANSAWRQNTLTLQAEHAKSRFDSDGLGIGEASKKDKASRYAITLSSFGPLSKLLSPLRVNTWQLHWQRQTVGEHFFSLANLGLPGDLRTDTTTLQFNWTQVQVSAEHSRAQNNINHQTDAATQTTGQTQVVTNYTPTLSSETGFWSSLGRPTFSVRLSQAQREQAEEDAIVVGYDLNDQTKDYQFSAFFQREKYSWSLQYGETLYKNHASAVMDGGIVLFQPAPDTRNRYSSVGLTLNPTKTISLFPALQWSDYKELDTSNHQDAFNFGLTANMRMFRNRMDMNMNYNRSEQTTIYSGNSGLDYQSEHASLIANWHAVIAKNANPGLKISLRYVWNEHTASFQPINNDYQVVLSMELNWEKGRLQ